MTLVVKLDSVGIDGDGRVSGHDAGATLVRRLLRVFDDAAVLGPRTRDCDGFGMVTPDDVPPDAVVVNMDVIDSVEVWRRLRAAGVTEPRIMNFVWWNVSRYRHRVETAALALSVALFPTFANSERTATEVGELLARLTIPPLAEQARVAWVNLGFRIEHIQPRAATHEPVVLYPAIYLSERKRPTLFFDVVSRVRHRVPLRVEARLHPSHLASEQAMRWSSHDWFWVGPLLASRSDYWQALARATAFLATASEESYGLEYVEALAAGAVGVLPDLPWAQALLPAGYPFLYSTPEQAEEMLHRALSDTETCRSELDAVAGGSFRSWIQEHHDDDRFEQAVAEQIDQWFGAEPSPNRG